MKVCWTNDPIASPFMIISMESSTLFVFHSFHWINESLTCRQMSVLYFHWKMEKDENIRDHFDSIAQWRIVWKGSQKVIHDRSIIHLSISTDVNVHKRNMQNGMNALKVIQRLCMHIMNYPLNQLETYPLTLQMFLKIQIQSYLIALFTWKYSWVWWFYHSRRVFFSSLRSINGMNKINYDSKIQLTWMRCS